MNTEEILKSGSQNLNPAKMGVHKIRVGVTKEVQMREAKI